MHEYSKKLLIFSRFPGFKLNNNIILRIPTESDAEAWMRYIRHPEVAKYVPDPCIPTDIISARREIQWYIKMFSGKTGIAWAIVDSKTGIMIGSISLEKWSFYHKRSEIAYDLDPAYWGQGIMVDAMNKCLNFAFKNMGILRIEAFTTICNVRSIGLLKKLGFSHEAVLKQHRYFKGEQIDVNIFALLKSEFVYKK